MPEQKVGIAAECICDLPKNYMKEHNIGVIYFHVRTDRGVFTDTDEVTAENILGYMETNETMPITSPPPAENYEMVFRELIKKYGEVVFISTGIGASASCSIAAQAVGKMGGDAKKVHIFDSKHLSTGLGHMVIRAAEMAEEGASAEEILAELEELKSKVSTTFIAVNADYLYRNGRVPKSVKKICDLFGIHPVLMMKNGSLTLKSVMFGNYDKASLRYVRKALKNAEAVDKKRIFITHVGCGMKKVEKLKNEILKQCAVEKIVVTKASATISCNCGPGTFGVLYVNEKGQ